MRLNTRTATNLGLLVALSIVFTRFLGAMIPVGGTMSLRISFGEIPLMLAGILFGPAAGALAGVTSDLIGFIINSHGGPYFPGFTLTAALTGIIPGVLLYRKWTSFSILELAFVVLFTDVITGMLLNTYWLTLMMDTGFFVLLPPRAFARLFTLPIYTLVIFMVRRAYLAYRQHAVGASCNR